MNGYSIDPDDLRVQSMWSERVFGPGKRTKGVLAHITEEVSEVRRNPEDIEEWADLLILTFDGALRQGFTPEQIIEAYRKKMDTNMYDREWPDYRGFSEDEPINHVRTPEPEYVCGDSLCPCSDGMVCPQPEPDLRADLDVVRNFKSSQTHLAKRGVSTRARAFGGDYMRPDPKTKALCGVNIKDGVVMREGTRVVCSACRHIEETA